MTPYTSHHFNAWLTRAENGAHFQSQEPVWSVYALKLQKTVVFYAVSVFVLFVQMCCMYHSLLSPMFLSGNIHMFTHFFLSSMWAINLSPFCRVAIIWPSIIKIQPAGKWTEKICPAFIMVGSRTNW